MSDVKRIGRYRVIKAINHSQHMSIAIGSTFVEHVDTDNWRTYAVFSKEDKMYAYHGGDMYEVEKVKLKRTELV